jgi:nucleotide-binding universal stress UspA family protein
VHAENDIPWCAILDAAKEKGCDLIVMASHGRTGFSAAFLGSETQKVLAQSTIPFSSADDWPAHPNFAVTTR